MFTIKQLKRIYEVRLTGDASIIERMQLYVPEHYQQYLDNITNYASFDEALRNAPKGLIRKRKLDN